MVGLASFLPATGLALIGGHAADRFGRRVILIGGRLRADRARLRPEWHSRGRTDLRPAPAVPRGPRTLAGPAVQVLLTNLMPLE